MQAVLHYDDGVMTVPYTPSADVAAGDVVVRSNSVGIAVRDIPADTLGSLNISGGVYTVTADAAIAVGDDVYWDDTANKVTETATAHVYFGKAVTASAADGDAIDVAHQMPTPDISTA